MKLVFENPFPSDNVGPAEMRNKIPGAVGYVKVHLGS
jgi:hypothetical protein